MIICRRVGSRLHHVAPMARLHHVAELLDAGMSGSWKRQTCF